MTNPKTYARPDVAAHYGHLEGLFEAEVRIINPMVHAIAQGSLLDLGVGGGRTSGELSRIATYYLGVDYSREMILTASRRHPNLNFRMMDVRDLSELPDGSFTHVFFLFNGLDYINHEGRLQALAEIRRVLCDRGTFLFTSHNRGFKRVGRAPWEVDYPLYEKVSRTADWLKHSKKRREMRQQTEEHPDYAIVNDDAHGYSLLTYYITPRAQVDQLFEAGFTPGSVFSQQGLQAEFSAESCWYYYVATKR